MTDILMQLIQQIVSESDLFSFRNDRSLANF